MLLLAGLAHAVEAAPALPEPARRFGVAIGGLGPEEAGLELRGVRIAVRYDLLEALTLELAGRSDPGALREPTEHQAAVVANSYDDVGHSYLRLPVQSVDWELSARADWGFVPRRAAGRLTGGPRLVDTDRRLPVGLRRVPLRGRLRHQQGHREHPLAGARRRRGDGCVVRPTRRHRTAMGWGARVGAGSGLDNDSTRSARGRRHPRPLVGLRARLQRAPCSVHSHVRRVGPTLSIAWVAAPRVELGLRGVWFPRVGSGGPCEPDATEFTCGISEAWMSPGVAYLTGSLSLELRIAPVVAESGAWKTAVGVAAGGGLVTTEDDLELLQAEDEPSGGPAHRTANQAHPATSIALIAELLRGPWVLRLRFGTLEYIEVLRSTTLLLQTELMASVELGSRW